MSARLPYLISGDLAETDRDLLERDINLFRILAHSPLAARKFNAVGHFLRHESTLSPRLRQLAILQVGYSTRSQYEYSHHVKLSRDFGLTDDEIGAVAIETDGGTSALDPFACDVLRAAREMTNERRLSEDLFRRLRAELGARDVVDLMITIAFYNAVALLLSALNIEVEADYMSFLDEFPLPIA